MALIELAREAGAADPEMLGNQIALLYEGASGLSTSLNDPAPWAQCPSDGARPSFRCGCRRQNRVVDRGRRDCDDGFLGATDDIEQVATFRTPRCQCVIDGLRDPLGIGSKFLQTSQQLPTPSEVRRIQCGDARH